eukprot:6203602-Pleurochrysis_carterae.AAC.2
MGTKDFVTFHKKQPISIIVEYLHSQQFTDAVHVIAADGEGRQQAESCLPVSVCMCVAQKSAFRAKCGQ